MLFRKFLAAVFALAAIASFVTAITAEFGGVSLMGGLVQLVIAIWLYWPARPAAVRGREREKELIQMREIAVRERIADIRSGRLPEVDVSAVKLRDGERAIFAAQAILLEKQTVGFEGGRASVNIRLTKSISVGQAAYRGKHKKEFVPVTAGELVVSDRRIVFAGELKSFEISRDKLTHYHQLGGGVLLFHVGAKTYSVMLSAGDDAVCDAALAA